MKLKSNSVRRTLKVALSILLFFAFAAFGYWNRTGTTKGRNCRVCAATFDHKTMFIYGIPVRSWDTEIKASAETRNYFDRYLGYPHEHEWTGGGYSRYGRRFVGCGSCSFGPYPQHQMVSTRIGLQLVAASGISDPQLRRRYFESIYQPSDVEHNRRIMETHRVIADQIPTEPWVKWYPYRVWGPDMNGIKIPDYVRAGGLAPDPL
jgi:hypothetical protein